MGHMRICHLLPRHLLRATEQATPGPRMNVLMKFKPTPHWATVETQWLHGDIVEIF